MTKLKLKLWQNSNSDNSIFDKTKNCLFVRTTWNLDNRWNVPMGSVLRSRDVLRSLIYFWQTMVHETIMSISRMELCVGNVQDIGKGCMFSFTNLHQYFLSLISSKVEVSIKSAIPYLNQTNFCIWPKIILTDKTQLFVSNLQIWFIIEYWKALLWILSSGCLASTWRN